MEERAWVTGLFKDYRPAVPDVPYFYLLSQAEWHATQFLHALMHREATEVRQQLLPVFCKKKKKKKTKYPIKLICYAVYITVLKKFSSPLSFSKLVALGRATISWISLERCC